MVQSTALQDFLQHDTLLDALHVALPAERLEALLPPPSRHANPNPKIPPYRALQLLLGLAWYRGHAIETVWNKLFPWFDTPPSGAACHYARERLGNVPQQVCKFLCQPLADPQTCPQAFHKGWRLLAIDGSSFAMPDSHANGKRFGYIRNQNGLSGYPQLHLVALCELGTHATLNYRVGKANAAEVPLAEQIVEEDLQPGGLVLADRLFFSYRLVSKIRQRGCHALFRLKTRQLKLPVEKVLPDGSYQTTIYANDSDRKMRRNGRVVRIIESKRTAPDPTSGEETLRLLTTMSDEELPAREAVALYWLRWEQELIFREIKVEMLGNAKVPLRNRQPELIEQEIAGLVMSHWLVRYVMYQASVATRTPVLELSFKKSWQEFLEFLRWSALGEWEARWEGLLVRISGQKNPRRRMRNYQRSTKQPRTKWPRRKGSGQQTKPELWKDPIPLPEQTDQQDVPENTTT